MSPSWWVKIGDFGIAKRVREGDATELRTATGTQGYEAPEIRGYIEVEEDKVSSVYTNVVDIWSLGCVIYKVVAKQVPFQNGRDIKRFCDNRIPFPVQSLQGKLTANGIDFLRSILVANPSDRPSAVVALQHPWLPYEDEYPGSSLQQGSAFPDGKELSASVEAKMENDNNTILASAAEGRRLCIGNLSSVTSKGDLTDFVKGYSVSIPNQTPTDRYSRSRFVEISTRSEAERAIAELSGTELRGSKVETRLVMNEQEERQFFNNTE
jgi:serine/threonine protein kinase